MTGPQNMNGTVYEPKLKIVGFMTVSFKQGSGEVAPCNP